LKKKLEKCKLALRSNFRDLVNDHFHLTERPTNIFANIAKEMFRFELKQQQQENWIEGCLRHVQTAELFWSDSTRTLVVLRKKKENMILQIKMRYIWN